MAENRAIRKTNKELKSLLPSVMKQISSRQQSRPDVILAAWPTLIGEHLGPMTKAVSFVDGVLTIKVRNSSLLSLLVQHERPRLLRELRGKFPNAKLRGIRFIIG